jgi:hypothetical protein
VRFEDLGPAIRGKLPFPIVNTTAHIEDAPLGQDGLLRNRVFEFTPLHYGSEYFGFPCYDFPMDYNRAISVSGAAVDSKTLREPEVRLAASAFNVDLGYSINNPNIGSLGRTFRRLLPLPFYPFAGHYQKDFNGDRISLSDGGHAENLGAYSLIRRLCSHIIIVDAEHDPLFQFESYGLLKKALRSEMGVDFRVDDIDRAMATGHFTGEKPVMYGTISYFPYAVASDKPAQRLELKVVYIKLSIDPKKVAVDEYPPEVKSFFLAHQFDTFVDQPDSFPQRTTADQTYPPDEVVAYRALGNFIVRENQNEIRAALGIE